MVDENNFSKKVYFPEEKQFRPIFSRFTEYGRPQVKFCQGPQGILALIVQVLRSFPLHLRGCSKHKILKKKAIFLAKNLVRPNFLVFSSMKNLREPFISLHKVL